MRVLLFLLFSVSLFAGETLNYRVKNGDSVVKSRWFIHGEKAELYRESETQTYQNNHLDETINFTLSDSSTNCDYQIRREGNRLIMSGTLNGKVINKSVEIDHKPWRQSVHDLSQFALKSKQSDDHIFWLVRPVDLKVVKMKAEYSRKRSDAEMITLKIAPVGVLSLLWKAYYSYRESDGTFVQYRSIHGPPGTPETVVSLI